MIAIKHRLTDVALCEFDVLTIKDAVITAVKSGANLRSANLGGADLCGANLYGADLSGANLYGANLRSANLYGADLSGANLCGADLYGAELYGANLRSANLRGADLRSADLSGADLRSANLYGADLYGADLGGADLCGANLYGAELSGANLGEKGKLVTGGYFNIGPVGSRKATLQAFHTDKGVWIKTGCFYNSLETFRTEVVKTHGNNKHGVMYLAICNLIEYQFTNVLKEAT